MSTIILYNYTTTWDVWLCYMSTLPRKELADFFLFLLNFAYDTVKVGECTKGNAKKKKKEKTAKIL